MRTKQNKKILNEIFHIWVYIKFPYFLRINFCYRKLSDRYFKKSCIDAVAIVNLKQHFIKPFLLFTTFRSLASLAIQNLISNWEIGTAIFGDNAEFFPLAPLLLPAYTTTVPQIIVLKQEPWVSSLYEKAYRFISDKKTNHFYFQVILLFLVSGSALQQERR